MVTLYGSAAAQTIARLIEALESGAYLCPECGWPEGEGDHVEVRHFGTKDSYWLCKWPRLQLG